MLKSAISLSALIAAAPPDTPLSPPGNGADPVPPPQFGVDEITGEPLPESDAAGHRPSSDDVKEPETPKPEAAKPPPSQPTRKQKVAHKLNLDEIRKTRAVVTPSVSQIFRIPVVTSPKTDAFILAHPTFGGLDDPMPIWIRTSVGQGKSAPLLVEPHMVDHIRAHGGKVGMCALYWCQNSTGGQFLGVVNVESDNDWIVTRRKIYEACRGGEWLKMRNAGNCWEGVPPPAPIPDRPWPDLSNDDVLNLAFDETVDENHPEFLYLVYGGLPPTIVRDDPSATAK
jgi:hypothetical protein